MCLPKYLVSPFFHRTNYEGGYSEWFYGKPDKLRCVDNRYTIQSAFKNNVFVANSFCDRMYGHYDFDFNGTETNNMRLKWLSICFNIDYDNGTMELYLNGAPLPARWPVIGGYLVT